MIGAAELRLAEQTVIGSVIRRPEMLREVLETVRPDDFSDLRLGAILEGVADLVQREEPIDAIVVGDNLARWDVRGIDLLDVTSWVDSVMTPATAAYHAGIVREAAILRALRSVGERLVQNASTTDEVGAAIALDGALTSLTALREGATRRSVRPRWLREVMAVPPEQDRADWVIPGLLERRDRAMITGSEGGGKSTFLRQLAIMAAAGLHPFSAERVAPVRVLVVDVENTERQWRRAVDGLVFSAERYGVRDPRDALALEVRDSLDVTNAGELAEIHRAIDLTKPDLVVIGPVYKLSPAGIKNDEDALPVLRALDSIRNRNVAMLIEAHAPHADSRTGLRDLRPIGSSALLRWPEFGLGIAKPKAAGDPWNLVRWRGDREERPWPFELTRQKDQPQRWPWEATAAWRMSNGTGPAPLV